MKRLIVIDLASARNWTEQEIYDGIHFTEMGSIFAAEFIANVLNEKFFKNIDSDLHSGS